MSNSFIKNQNKEKRLIFIWQIMIAIIFIAGWEILTKLKIINPFVFSSPSAIIMTISELFKNNMLFKNITITNLEIIISFVLSYAIAFITSMLMWWFPKFNKIINPYLTILNSLPKVALGPIFIIWTGANIFSIIIMALSISMIISIINLSNGFNSTDQNKLILLKSFKATKFQLFKYVVVPSNYINLIETLKINISMNLIGVIMGELLVSKLGIGYLIMYGSQVFNLNLVMTGIILLGIISIILYLIVCLIEKKILTKIS